MTAYSTAPHLPDPETQPGFYGGVTTKRLFAWIVDVLIIAAFMVPIVVLTLGLAVLVLAPIWLIVSFLYRWATIASGSATLGMRFMSIELRDAYGKRLDGAQAFLHTLGYII